MKINTTIFALLAQCAICLAQNFNISGVVKNSEGDGIEGVMVRLGKFDLATTTGLNGNFALAGSINGVMHPTNSSALGGTYPFRMVDDRLFFSVAKQSHVKVMVYDGNGKLVVSHDGRASPGDRLLALPHVASGIHIYRITVNSIEYTFKCVTGIGARLQPVSSWTRSPPAKQSQATADIDDALLFTKEGFQLYRIIMTRPDTSGIQITMTPLVTGTVTDADGNTYKTVQYGNQVWTVENLRTTKYNDGTSILLVSDSITWSKLETPGCCFFGYTTDTAEQRKWGAFYNWYAVNTGKLAPTGWHVSTDEDWDALQNYLIASGYNFDGMIGENKIAKSLAATTGWLTSTDSGAIGNDTIKNNASGFSGLPNGYCDYAGETYYRNWYAFWWTATSQDSTFVKIRGISYTSSDLKCTAFTKVYGLSIRLVRDK